MSGRRTLPRSIARAVLANLHESLVPMIYSTAAPGSYVIYLHRDDFAEIEGIVPALSGQINRALDEALARLEQPRWWDRVLHPARDRMPPIEAAPHRSIDIMPDPNNELERGEVGVHSELRLPAGDDSAAPAVRVTMTTAGAADRDVPTSVGRPPAAAVLTVEDMGGRYTHALLDNPTVVGRGGPGSYVHVRLRADDAVSKEHCRIRRDDASGEFFIKDLSRNGTSVNGARLPAGVDYEDGEKRELNGCEVRLQDGASIGLAEAVSIEFRRVRP